MSLLASTSYALIRSSPSSLGSIRHISGSNRYVKGKPKPALTPLLRSPHHPKLPLPSSGASQPHPRDLSPSFTPTTSSVPLDTGGLTFHHSPPPSASTHTTGSVPPLLKWLGGESVRLTGEEEAPLLRKRREGKGDIIGAWSEEMKDRMREMRAEGKSRMKIARRWVILLPFSLSCGNEPIEGYWVAGTSELMSTLPHLSLRIPTAYSLYIQRIAPLTPVQVAERDQQLEERMLTWGYRKRLSRAIRAKRREFW